MEYEVGKWYGWNGGECPVHPETVVEVCHAETGIITLKRRAEITAWHSEKLIAFRIIKEHKEPREFWVNPRTNLVTSEYDPESVQVREVLPND